MWAAVSAALLVPLLCGYVAEVGPVHHSISGTGAAAQLHRISISTGEGRIRIASYSRTWDLTRQAIPPPFYFIAQPRMPSLRRSLWEFDAHQIVATAPFSGQIYLIAFPIWCLALPLLIAPTLWWQRKRKDSQHQRGFTVDLIPACNPAH